MADSEEDFYKDFNGLMERVLRPARDGIGLANSEGTGQADQVVSADEIRAFSERYLAFRGTIRNPLFAIVGMRLTYLLSGLLRSVDENADRVKHLDLAGLGLVDGQVTYPGELTRLVLLVAGRMSGFVGEERLNLLHSRLDDDRMNSFVEDFAWTLLEGYAAGAALAVEDPRGIVSNWDKSLGRVVQSISPVVARLPDGRRPYFDVLSNVAQSGFCVCRARVQESDKRRQELLAEAFVFVKNAYRLVGEMPAELVDATLIEAISGGAQMVAETSKGPAAKRHVAAMAPALQRMGLKGKPSWASTVQVDSDAMKSDRTNWIGALKKAREKGLSGH